MTAGEVVELSAAQRREHEADERIVDAGLATFIEVGRALVRIRDRRSYVLTHSSFGAYVRDRFRFNVPYAYNLMMGAEVITLLEGQVEVLPANARVAYELRTLLDEPDELVKAWQRTIEQYGDKPIGRDVARVVRGEPPVRRRELPRSTGNGHSSELADDALLFDDALTRVGDGLEAAKSVQRRALRDADAVTLAQWARRTKQLRTMAADLQRALARKT